MTEHNAIETIVAESYRTKIDAEDLRRMVKVLLERAMWNHDEIGGFDKASYYYSKGQELAYTTVLRLIDEKEKGR